MTSIQNIKTLHQLLDEDCRGFSIGEHSLSKVLPIWISKSSSLKLKNILQIYYEQIKQHVKQLDVFFEEENITYLNAGNVIMNAFITDTEDKMISCTDPMVKDASILASVQNINHYKIASYGSAAAFADTLGMAKTSVLFYQFELNEKQIDKQLSELAIHEINKNAIAMYLSKQQD